MSPRTPGRRRTSGARRSLTWSAAVGLLVLVGALVVGLVPHGAAVTPVRLAASSQAGALPADCQPRPVGPPYQVGITATITNGHLTVGPASVHGIDAKICGVITFVPGTGGCAATGRVVVPSDGQVFATGLKAVLALVPGQPVVVPFAVVPHQLTGSFGCGASTHGLPLAVAAEVAALAGGSLFGVTCPIAPPPFTISGVAGDPADGATTSYSSISGTFTASHFLVSGAGTSDRCPASAAANLDPLAGLPSTSTTLVLPFVTSLYQPR